MILIINNLILLLMLLPEWPKRAPITKNQKALCYNWVKWKEKMPRLQLLRLIKVLGWKTHRLLLWLRIQLRLMQMLQLMLQLKLSSLRHSQQKLKLLSPSPQLLKKLHQPNQQLKKLLQFKPQPKLAPEVVSVVITMMLKTLRLNSPECKPRWTPTLKQLKTRELPKTML